MSPSPKPNLRYERASGELALAPPTSLAQLAASLGVSASLLRNWSTGDVSPPLAMRPILTRVIRQRIERWEEYLRTINNAPLPGPRVSGAARKSQQGISKHAIDL